MHISIAGDSKVPVWGLGGRERLRRQFARISGTTVVAELAEVPAGAPALVVRGDCVFDVRVLRSLVEAGDALVLRAHGDGPPVAIRAAGVELERLARLLTGGDAEAGPDTVPVKLPHELARGFDRSLRKHEVPRVLPITAGSCHALESELFDSTYKGVTDLVTKWLWPRPAFRATHLCVRLHVTPNQVTLFGLFLAVVAGIAFWYGRFGAGLILAWIMTFLDTVDGKLARVTVNYSRFGDVLDHGLDLIHPPLWYLAWGMGLAANWTGTWPLSVPLWLMLLGYLGGRLCEGAFQLFVAPFSIFVWRPLDSFHRLVTARRNPNLLFLTASWFAVRPDLGLWLVALWHCASTTFLAVRLCQGWFLRRRMGPLQTWLAEVEPARDRHSLAVRVFTRTPAAIPVTANAD